MYSFISATTLSMLTILGLSIALPSYADDEGKPHWHGSDKEIVASGIDALSASSSVFLAGIENHYKLLPASDRTSDAQHAMTELRKLPAYISAFRGAVKASNEPFEARFDGIKLDQFLGRAAVQLGAIKPNKSIITLALDVRSKMDSLKDSFDLAQHHRYFPE